MAHLLGPRQQKRNSKDGQSIQEPPRRQRRIQQQPQREMLRPVCLETKSKRPAPVIAVVVGSVFIDVEVFWILWLFL